MPKVPFPHLLNSPKLPVWFRQAIPDSGKLNRMRLMLGGNGIATVCQSAHCPNLGKCWENGAATMMILGDVCTRACRFCAVKSGKPSRIDTNEPKRVAQIVSKLKLSYVVITSVTRDDLPDGGAAHFAETVAAIRFESPKTKIELLIPDLKGDSESVYLLSKCMPDVMAHNIETVKTVFKKVRPEGDYARSMQVLKEVKSLMPSVYIKSGFMVGMGENDDDIMRLLRELRSAGCDIITIGQYLAPSNTKRHLPVKRFVTPEQFSDMKKLAIGMGFEHVEAGPLVRSSFMAEEGYRRLGKISGK